MSDRIYTCTNMASAGLHTETQRTTLRHNAYFPSKNASKERYSSRNTPFFDWCYCTTRVHLATNEQTR